MKTNRGGSQNIMIKYQLAKGRFMLAFASYAKTSKEKN